jgi:hypothetical protein
VREQKRKGGLEMSHDALSEFVAATAEGFGIPGVAVGV